jgi:hypothetical protein
VARMEFFEICFGNFTSEHVILADKHHFLFHESGKGKGFLKDSSLTLGDVFER